MNLHFFGTQNYAATLNYTYAQYQIYGQDIKIKYSKFSAVCFKSGYYNRKNATQCKVGKYFGKLTLDYGFAGTPAFRIKAGTCINYGKTVTPTG